MTVPSETNRSGPYNGNGVTTVFNYGFRIVDEDHLRVILTSAAGVETVLVVDADYIVSDVGEPAGGSIALLVAPATGETITILRSVPLTQETDLENQGAYYAETVEDRFDLTVMQIQQVAEEVDRSIRVPASTDPDTDLQMPAPEANHIIGWNETASGLQNVDPVTLASVIAYGTANADIFIGDGVTTVFSLSGNPAALNNLDVAIGGVTQLPGVDYTWTGGTALTFTSAPANGAAILVRYMQALAQGTTTDELVLSDDGASGSLWSNIKGFITYLRSSVGSSIIGFLQSGTGATARTVQDKLREIHVHVKDFGAVCDGVADDTAAIQAAIDALPAAGGEVHGTGICKITSTITISKPAHLVGTGKGEFYGAPQDAGWKIKWAGAVDGDMFHIGGFGANIVGGGLRNLMLDGSAIAGRCVLNKDHQRGWFSQLTIYGAKAAQWEFNNTAGIEPTGFHFFQDIRMPMRAYGTPNAVGFLLNGTFDVMVPAGGVTLCTMDRVRIDHENGAGVQINQIGDNFIWLMLQTFRADSDTGPGVWFAATAASTTICGGHMFLNPIPSAGIRADTPGACIAVSVISGNQIDMNAGVKVLYGAGARDISYTGANGFDRGLGLIPGLHSSRTRDNMAFIRFDSANDVLMTANGNWKTARVGSGSVTDGGQPGGCSRVTTGLVNNDSTAVFDNSTISTGGWKVFGGALAQALFSAITSADVKYQVGFMNTTDGNPTNGVYFEFDPSVSAFWQCVCRNGGAETRTATAFGLLAGLVLDFLIFIDDAGASASFALRTPGNTSYGGNIKTTTNVPTAGLPFCARVQTKTAALAQFDLYGVKVGSPDEPAMG